LANRLPEDAGVVATDEEELVALQFRWLLWALVKQLSGGAMRRLLVSGSKETVR